MGSIPVRGNEILDIFISSLERTFNDAKRGVKFHHSTRNASRSPEYDGEWGVEASLREWSVSTLPLPTLQWTASRCPLQGRQKKLKYK